MIKKTLIALSTSVALIPVAFAAAPLLTPGEIYFAAYDQQYNGSELNSKAYIHVLDKIAGDDIQVHLDMTGVSKGATPLAMKADLLFSALIEAGDGSVLQASLAIRMLDGNMYLKPTIDASKINDDSELAMLKLQADMMLQSDTWYAFSLSDIADDEMTDFTGDYFEAIASSLQAQGKDVSAADIRELVSVFFNAMFTLKTTDLGSQYEHHLVLKPEGLSDFITAMKILAPAEMDDIDTADLTEFETMLRDHFYMASKVYEEADGALSRNKYYLSADFGEDGFYAATEGTVTMNIPDFVVYAPETVEWVDTDSYLPDDEYNDWQSSSEPRTGRQRLMENRSSESYVPDVAQCDDAVGTPKYIQLVRKGLCPGVIRHRSR